MDDYHSMTLYELRDLARQRGVAGFSKAEKGALVYALENGLQHVPRSGEYPSSRSRGSSSYEGNYIGSHRGGYDRYDRYSSRDRYDHVGQGRYTSHSKYGKYGSRDRVGHSDDYDNPYGYDNYSSSYNYGAGVGHRRVGRYDYRY